MPDVLRFGIEWDETSQRALCQKCLAKARALFPFLVTRKEIVASHDGPLFTAASVFPTMILSGTTAENIWSGICKALDMSPFDFACRTKTFILCLISDAAPSKLAMVKKVQQRCPQNAVDWHMKCAPHQVHLCSAPIWVGLGLLSDMLCTTNAACGY